MNYIGPSSQETTSLRVTELGATPHGVMVTGTHVKCNEVYYILVNCSVVNYSVVQCILV